MTQIYTLGYLQTHTGILLYILLIFKVIIPLPDVHTIHMLYTSCSECIGGFMERLEEEVLLRQTNPPSCQK